MYVNCSWIDTRWQQYSTHLHTNSTQNNTIKQNTQNGTYITIRIHKHNSKNTQFTNQTEPHKTYNHIYSDTKWNQKNMEDCDKRNNHIGSKLRMICISSSNDRHPVTKTFTTLRSTSLHLSTLHFLSFKLHPTTSKLHST